jgi:ubiquinone/menaquinone biosynthesis C-methylase UbiE
MGDRMPGNDDIRHPLFARLYPRLSQSMERQGVGDHRERLLAGVRGRVIEVGAGNGLNFEHYPATVTEVLAVEPEPHLRRLAEEAAGSAPVPVRVVAGRAERLPAEDGSRDVAVLSLVLCSVRDQRLALAEVSRVLRPGGEIRFYEHVVSARPVVALVQRGLDATVWPRLVGGCHLARDTRRSIEEAGFVLDRCDSVAIRGEPASGLTPHLLGAAHKPQRP